MTKINFNSENFKVDFLSFNTQFNDHDQIQKIADYLSDNFKCNTEFEDMENLNKNRTLVKKNKNHIKAFFRSNQVKYWDGISLDFTGENAKYFYEAIKLKELDWEKMDFDKTNLGRIDLCYDREFIKTDKAENINLFMQNCKKQINLNFPSIFLDKSI